MLALLLFVGQGSCMAGVYGSQSDTEVLHGLLDSHNWMPADRMC